MKLTSIFAETIRIDKERNFHFRKFHADKPPSLEFHKLIGTLKSKITTNAPSHLRISDFGHDLVNLLKIVFGKI